MPSPKLTSMPCLTLKRTFSCDAPAHLLVIFFHVTRFTCTQLFLKLFTKSAMFLNGSCLRSCIRCSISTDSRHILTLPYFRRHGLPRHSPAPTPMPWVTTVSIGTPLRQSVSLSLCGRFFWVLSCIPCYALSIISVNILLITFVQVQHPQFNPGQRAHRVKLFFVH